jgi:integrase
MPVSALCPQRLDSETTDKMLAALPAPTTGNRIVYDDQVKGFGLRITSAGARAFILNYRVARRERRITIGSYPDWKLRAAREQAKAYKRRIDLGEDPMATREGDRTASTIGELCDLFEADYLPNRRVSTQEDYRALIRLYIRPRFGKLKVAALRHADIAAWHREIARRAPYRANRMVAVLSVMMTLAVREGLRPDNPTQGVERAHEEKRERFLSPAEIAKLAEALAAHPEKISANAIRMLMLTGARRGEVLSATWDHFDLGAGVWTKPSAHTKQKKPHRIPLSAPTLALLADMRREAIPGCPLVFPSIKTSKWAHNGKMAYQALTEIKRTWASVCRAAGISDARLHDLRHSFASALASSGLSLHIVGALLGHTQPRTSARYAHLYDDTLRAATERVGAMVTGVRTEDSQVVPLIGRRQA